MGERTSRERGGGIVGERESGREGERKRGRDVGDMEDGREGEWEGARVEEGERYGRDGWWERAERNMLINERNTGFDGQQPQKRGGGEGRGGAGS